MGNFILGLDRPGGTGYEASRALLREVDGLPRHTRGQSVCNCASCRARRQSGTSHGYGYDYDRVGDAYSYGGSYGTYGHSAGESQDWGRKYLTGNGGCIYCDLNHLELAAPETVSAYDHVACRHAMLRIARAAQEAANRRLPTGQRLQVLVCNSDGLSNSFGSHLNFLVSRHLWDDLFHRRLQRLLFLAAFQVSSIVLTGSGKVGSENGRPATFYQIAQRADFMETLVGSQTTFNRPIVNSRDEALCGRRYGAGELDGRPADSLARLHVIFYDSALSDASILLGVGPLQIVLCMLETGWFDSSLLLDDPIEALVTWSHDPSLTAQATLASGRRLTAVELQFLFYEKARRFIDEGGCDGRVPRARDIAALWEDTLLKLRAQDFGALAPRLDWVQKFCTLQHAMDQRPGYDWNSPEVKCLDHLYSSLDPTEGLYFSYQQAGLVERYVSDERIAHFVENPPEDTRAWGRAMALRLADPDGVEDVDWDSIRFKGNRRGSTSRSRTLELPHPLGFTRAKVEPAFRDATDLAQALDRLEAFTLEASRYGSPPVGSYPVLATIPTFREMTVPSPARMADARGPFHESPNHPPEEEN